MAYGKHTDRLHNILRNGPLKTWHILREYRLRFDPDMSSATCHAMLGQYSRIGKIKRLGHGLYARRDYNGPTPTPKPAPDAVALALRKAKRLRADFDAAWAEYRALRDAAAK